MSLKSTWVTEFEAILSDMRTCLQTKQKNKFLKAKKRLLGLWGSDYKGLGHGDLEVWKATGSSKVKQGAEALQSPGHNLQYLIARKKPPGQATGRLCLQLGSSIPVPSLRLCSSAICHFGFAIWFSSCHCSYWDMVLPPASLVTKFGQFWAYLLFHASGSGNWPGLLLGTESP